MDDSYKTILPFDARMLAKHDLSWVDLSIATNLFLRAAYVARDVRGIRYWLTQAHRIATLHGSITSPPYRTESALMYQQQILEFASELFRSGERRKNMLDLLVSLSTSESESTTWSITIGSGGGESWSGSVKTTSRSDSKSSTEGGSETKTSSTSKDGENIRSTDLIGGYERLIQSCFSDAFLKFYLRYLRALSSNIFVRVDTREASKIWDSYLEWWLSAHNDKVRASVLEACSGGFLEVTPADVFVIRVDVNRDYQEVAGWIHNHLSCLWCGPPDLRLLQYAISLADTYLNAGNEIDPFTAVKELQSLIEPEIDVFYGNSFRTSSENADEAT
jgi:hypothetical protein